MNAREILIWKEYVIVLIQQYFVTRDHSLSLLIVQLCTYLSKRALVIIDICQSIPNHEKNQHEYISFQQQAVASLLSILLFSVGLRGSFKSQEARTGEVVPPT